MGFNCVSIAGVGSEVDLLLRFNLFNNDYGFERNLDIGSADFPNWAELNKYILSKQNYSI